MFFLNKDMHLCQLKLIGNLQMNTYKSLKSTVSIVHLNDVLSVQPF